VHRIESAVLSWTCPSFFDTWHDRVAFHFLTEEAGRTSYANLASNTVGSGGTLIVATFALDGPRSCSGLPIYRTSLEVVTDDFATSFELLETLPYDQVAPDGTTQRFQIGSSRRK
jgi:hypothetical protein